jgi:hypothetical protein
MHWRTGRIGTFDVILKEQESRWKKTFFSRQGIPNLFKMKTGVPALILLFGMVASLFLVTMWRLSAVRFHVDNAERVRIYCTVCFSLALPFWLWAVVNTVTGSLDLGVFSMGLVVISAAVALALAPGRRWVGGFVLPLSCLTVVANYILALVVVTTPSTFVAYAASGLTIWVLAAVCGLFLHFRLISEGHDGSGSYAKVGNNADHSIST